MQASGPVLYVHCWVLMVVCTPKPPPADGDCTGTNLSLHPRLRLPPLAPVSPTMRLSHEPRQSGRPSPVLHDYGHPNPHQRMMTTAPLQRAPFSLAAQHWSFVLIKTDMSRIVKGLLVSHYHHQNVCTACLVVTPDGMFTSTPYFN